MSNKVDDLKLIKKDYGEKMAHLCRQLFPTILERPGALHGLMSVLFEKNKSLYVDIIKENKVQEFKNYVCSFCPSEIEVSCTDKRTVKEILDEAGYDFYECECYEKEDENDSRIAVRDFEKYYAKGEALCTFSDPSRIRNNHIFFIVKKDVDKIKREDFKKPRREDDYGISVLDLQFDRGAHQHVSIKCRYNHTVSSPDSTYANNLDSIAEGLTDAFKREYFFNIGNEYKSDFYLDHYVRDNEGKFYKYNIEIANIHFCPDNVVLHHGEKQTDLLDKSKYLVIENYILNLSDKCIMNYTGADHKATKTFRQLYCASDENSIYYKSTINKIVINNVVDGKIVEIQYMKDNEPAKSIIKINKDNRIIDFEDNYIKDVGPSFLAYCDKLEKVTMNNLESCSSYFIYNGENVKEINLPKLEFCKDDFLYNNKMLKKIEFPSLKYVANSFLNRNEIIDSIKMDNLINCGSNFLRRNKCLEELHLSSLKFCGDFFLFANNKIKLLYLPSLEECGNDFLYCLKDSLTSAIFPKLEKCDLNFLYNATSVSYIEFDKLTCCGSCFMYSNNAAKKIILPSLKYVEDKFFRMNKIADYVYCPELRMVESNFLENNETLEYANFPKLRSCRSYFLRKAPIKKVDLPKLEYTGIGFMAENNTLTQLYLPSIIYCWDDFLEENECLTTLNCPKLSNCGNRFLYSNNAIKVLSLPELFECYDFMCKNTSIQVVYVPKLAFRYGEFLPMNTTFKYATEPVEVPRPKNHAKKRTRKN